MNMDKIWDDTALTECLVENDNELNAFRELWDTELNSALNLRLRCII